jgi:hypothetical protein
VNVEKLNASMNVTINQGIVGDPEGAARSIVDVLNRSYGRGGSWCGSVVRLMTQWSPEWSLSINGVDYTNVTLSNLTIATGRTDIYSQPRAGYCSVDILNLDLTPITIDVNDGVTIKVKNSTGTFVNLFGGDVTDIETIVDSTGTGGVNELNKAYGFGRVV